MWPQATSKGLTLQPACFCPRSGPFPRNRKPMGRLAHLTSTTNSGLYLMNSGLPSFSSYRYVSKVAEGEGAGVLKCYALRALGLNKSEI